MSKNNKQNNNVKVNDVIEMNEFKEENGMSEKKNIIEKVKEFGNNLPKPVKIGLGAVAALAAVGGTALVVVSKIRNGEDIDFDGDIDFEDSDLEDIAAEAEVPVEE